MMPAMELMTVLKLTIRVTVGQLLGQNHIDAHLVFELRINGPPIDINILPISTI